MASSLGLKVRDIFDIDNSLAIMVSPETPFEDVVKNFASKADLRGVFVVDANDKLRGVLTRHDLLHWAAGKLHVRDPHDESWRDVFRVMAAIKVQDACRPGSEKCTVTADDPVERVLQLMFENELIDVPVVNDEGTIIGDVRLTEIMAKVFETQEK